MVQTRNCGSAAVEDYFQRWQTLTAQWASYASNHFIGAAATWLEFYLQYIIHNYCGLSWFLKSWQGLVVISTLSWLAV
jgi:hypothetical protein